MARASETGLPSVEKDGDLPPGIYRTTLREALGRFGEGSRQRVVVFGSFVTGKRDPADVDVFLLMENSFNMGQVSSEARLLFDHAAAQAHFGASVFWLRRLAAFGGEEQAISGWQIKRDGTRRGILEIMEERT